MDASDVYERIRARLEPSIEVGAEELTHAVLMSMAERLTPDEAAELGAELPEELGDILAGASGSGALEHDEFVEDVAARLDLDDEDAELGARAVLQSIREAIEPMVTIDQVLETLPRDLAQMMHR
jgi:uncharacterized protein (DUF2267 family)